MLAAMLAAALVASADCPAGISAETARHVYDTLNVPLGGSGCVLRGVTTGRSMLTATWARGDHTLPPLRVFPRECVEGAPPGAGELVLDVPPELLEQCPQLRSPVTALGAMLEQEPLAADRAGTFNRRQFQAARLLFAALLVLMLALLVRRRPRLDLELAALFMVALAARLAVRPTLVNWYSDVLPAHGPPGWMRFGPGSFAFDSLIRNVLPWNDTTLFVSRIVLGALAVPLFVAALREVALSRAACVTAGLLLAISPLHVRISASSSEHVLSATLTFALLAAWLRAVRTGDLWMLVLSLLLLPAAVLTRVDCLTQVAFIPLWSLVRDRSEPARSRGRAIFYVAYAIAAGAMAAYVWLVVEPDARHAGPTAGDVAHALRALFPQFGELAIQSPRWMSIAVVASIAAGAVWMARTRPWLLVRTGAGALLPFVLLGRQLMHDELVGARYFLFPLAVLLIPAAYLWGESRWRTVVIPALLAVSLATSWPAYGARYAFQDEYSFLREALARLPDDCLVYGLSPRGGQFRADLDCCLDVAHSPLPLVFPRLRFRSIEVTDPTPHPGSVCAAWYDGAACSMKDGPLVHDTWGAQIEAFHRMCSNMSAGRSPAPVAASTVSARATNPFFTAPPEVSLHRIE